MSKFCPECGTPATGGKFCAECGHRFATADASAMPSTNAITTPQTAVASALMNNPAATAAAASAVANHLNSNSNGRSWQQNMGMSNNGNGSTGASSWQPPATKSYDSPHGGGYNRSNQPQQPPPPAGASWRAQSPHQAASGAAAPAPWQAQQPAAMAMGASAGADYSVPPNPTSDPSLFKPNPLPTATVVPEPVPPAATGAEAQQVYEKCVQTIRASRGGANEDGVKVFKQNCRLYGLRQMDVQTFYDSLVRELGPDGTLAFVPDLARLVPDDDRRRELVEYNASKRPIPTATGIGVGAVPSSEAVNARAGFANRSSSSSVGSYRERGSSVSGQNGTASKGGMLKGRYADHPNCDICNISFDVTKRRHHCRHCGFAVCSSCSPLRLLIPPGQQIDGAKGYDPSAPQRVCIQCAPKLHEFQEQLVQQYAQANEDNHYEARGRLVHVPFSNSLFKECQNAADIIGNFFRNDWGASADRAIPVAFLQKAHGLAIMSIVKAGFLVTGQIGTGLVVAKLPDGSWSAPSAIGVGGLSGGFEIGGELVELMIILGSEGAVKVFHKTQANIGAGLDLAVGPYGRSAVAAAAVSASGLNANYSYSHSKGFFAGISLQGKVIIPRNDLNRKFYGRDLQPGEILSGHIAAPNAARPLYEAIEHAMQGIEVHRESVERRSSMMGPCRLCNCQMFVPHTKQVWNKNCKTCKHVH